MRTRSVRAWIIAAMSATLALGLAARPALASHYAVADVPSLISAGDSQKLMKAGVSTTEDLLARAAKAPDRKVLAKRAGLGNAALLHLARRCDLLRIKGVGPEMVLLMEAAGVKSTADLAARDPAALTTASDAANSAKKISEKPPTQPQFEDWISQAKKLPQVIESR